MLSTRIQHFGLCVIAQREEAATVLRDFAETEIGLQCELLDVDEVRKRFPGLPLAEGKLCLLSPHELRLEAPKALPALTTYLQKEWDVSFQNSTTVLRIDEDRLDTSAGTFAVENIIVCPGTDFSTLYPERLRARNLQKCKLQMLRLADPGFRLPFAVQSDLSLVRYNGYADLPAAKPLLDLLKREQPDHLERGIHLIVVQNEDGSLVVGDSHHYSDEPTPFYDTETENLILAEFERMFAIEAPPVIERWTGIYPYGEEPYFVDAPAPNTRIVAVTCGAGMSTAFAIAENTIQDLLGTGTMR